MADELKNDEPLGSAVQVSAIDSLAENLSPIPVVEHTPKTSRDLRFWLVILSGCLVDFTTALDATIITTALPKITTAIHGEKQYVWLANTYVLASTAVMPFVGQTSNIFGRRMPMIISVILFSIGNALAGASVSSAMLIASRVVTGLGGGGIFVLNDLIICDLVPVRERSKFLGFRITIATIATIIGPVLGGVLGQSSWRWVFFINLPFSGIALLIMVPFLRLKHKREPTWAKKLARVDFLGNILFVASIIAILFGLIMGGTLYPWSSWHIIVPLVLGFSGWAVFHTHQASPICKEPSMPPLLFGNRTSVVCLALTFIACGLLEWVVYFLPIYFQALKAASPLTSGVDVLPFSIFYVPLAVLTGGIMSKFGKYKPIHWVGFASTSVACGLLSILDASSPTVEWVFFQLILSVGAGCTLISILPVIQASLPETYAATATGTFNFVRNFGFVWGITLPSIIFNARIDQNLHWIQDEAIRLQLRNGAAYGYAGTGAINQLPDQTMIQVHDVYASALKTLWQVAAGIAALAFILVFIEKDLVLSMDLETDFGMEETKQEK
ncbi:putative transporter [Daldinia decipiens]|uniref:putative transporter n=1 Tax=Daldinia decipiens TaxID=326647 RepID=UPI0020C5AB5A|nr:putative transporter [Daldinia decipiens]KAI1653945.1 putative transporter [Daldinia decipiens]